MSTVFGRTTILEVGKRVAINSDDLTMRFDVVFDDDTDPNESVIEIFNLSKSTIAYLKRNERVSLTAGYKTDGKGVILASRVSSVRTLMSGVDKVTRITVIDGPNLDGIEMPERTEITGKKKKTVKKTRKKTYAKNTKASQIVRDLIPLLGVAVGKIRIPRDVTFSKGYTVEGKVLDELKKLAKTCRCQVFIHKQRLYFCTVADVATSTQFNFSSDTGLIGSPEYYENDEERGYKLRALLQFRVGVGSLVNIDSRTAKGRFRVKRGRHYWNGSDFMTEIEVVKA
ncbi:hypothetical protein EauM23_00030 [Exiguobacterium phage vB_EauM-23]|nr:hypothetical protein EauM23_00030 [Exiguobacterium phage vB_EauM-23]